MSLRAALTPQRERQKKLVMPQRVALTPQRGAEETTVGGGVEGELGFGESVHSGPKIPLRFPL